MSTDSSWSQAPLSPLLAHASPEIPFGIYVHVPYCRERCLYCDFALTPVDRAPSASFANAAVAEILSFGEAGVAGYDASARFRGRAPVSVYFGGGTPSMLEAHDIGRILEAVERRFGLAAAAEVTLEANPEDASRERFSAFAAAGVNRLSLGVQALEDRFLHALGRAHDAAGAEASLRVARSAGIENVSIDLIFGVCGMTAGDWNRTLERAASLEPSHLSCYGLTVENGTRLSRMVTSGETILPEDDDQATMYESAVETLAAAGMPRYEVSNFAPPERRAVHNSLYWRYAEWIGIGPSSHSFARLGPAASRQAGGLRWWNHKNPFSYLVPERHPPLGGHEVITGRPAMGEMAFTGLRMADGLSDDAFRDVFGLETEEVFGETIRRLERLDFARRDNGRVRLTDRGFLLSDAVFSDLVETAA